MGYSTIVSYCLVSAFLVRSDEIQFSCRPKPGCSFEHCDPLPPGLRDRDGFDADLYRENNGYHIVCQGKGGAGYGDKDSNGDIVALKNDEPACTDLPEVPYSTWNCTNDNSVGSRCVITCTQGHISENGNDIECKEEKVWSEPIPKCVCKTGFAGETCEHTTYWSVFKRNIDSRGGLNLNFGGNPMTCRNEASFYRWRLVYKCFCTDLKTGRQARCDNYQSETGSCEHASSALIRSMAERAIYPKPTDEGSMPKNC